MRRCFAPGRDAHIAIQPTDQKITDLAGAPMRLIAFEADDQAFDLSRKLVGVTHGPPPPIAQRLEPVFLVAVIDLVAGLARDTKLATDLAHRLAVQQPGDKPQTLVHHRTLLPRHRHLPSNPPGGTCYPCVRYKTSTYVSGRSEARDMLKMLPRGWLDLSRTQE